jgi:hypothetical protein
MVKATETTETTRRRAMMTAMSVMVVASAPFLVVLGLFALASWRDRSRSAIIERQIALTDAITRDLGAIVAPVVRKRPGGGLRVEVAAPLGRPAIVGRIVAIAHDVLAGSDRGRAYEIVLVPQADTRDGAPAPRVAPLAAVRLRAA